jgi:hypothetical protein
MQSLPAIFTVQPMQSGLWRVQAAGETLSELRSKGSALHFALLWPERSSTREVRVFDEGGELEQVVTRERAIF